MRRKALQHVKCWVLLFFLLYRDPETTRTHLCHSRKRLYTLKFWTEIEVSAFRLLELPTSLLDMNHMVPRAQEAPARLHSMNSMEELCCYFSNVFVWMNHLDSLYLYVNKIEKKMKFGGSHISLHEYFMSPESSSILGTIYFIRWKGSGSYGELNFFSTSKTSWRWWGINHVFKTWTESFALVFEIFLGFLLFPCLSASFLVLVFMPQKWLDSTHPSSSFSSHNNVFKAHRSGEEVHSTAI